MDKKTITYWKDGDFWLGYINDYPEYISQGVSIEDLVDHLKDIFHDISNELVPGKRQTMELDLS